MHKAQSVLIQVYLYIYNRPCLATLFPLFNNDVSDVLKFYYILFGLLHGSVLATIFVVETLK